MYSTCVSSKLCEFISVCLCICVFVFLCTMPNEVLENCPHPLFKQGALWQTWHTLKVVLSQSWEMKYVKLPFLPLFNAFLMNVACQDTFFHISNRSFLDWFNLLWKILNWRKTSCERHVCRMRRFSSDKHKLKISNGGIFLVCGIYCVWIFDGLQYTIAGSPHWESLVF